MQNIIVTESLAKGLKSRFFAEMSEACVKVQAGFKVKGKNKRNREGFVKTVTGVKKTFEEFILLFYEGGSKNKPYVTFDLLTVLEGREYNTWNEKCLTGVSFLVNFEPRLIDDADAAYNISEHVIARLFLRTQPKYIGDVIDCRYIREEMYSLPFWSNYWALTLYSSDKNPFEGNCFPVIPSLSGLFMSEYSAQTKCIEVRTFIDDALLNFEQMEVKKLLTEVSKDVIESPLSFFRLVVSTSLERLELLHGVIAYRILRHKNYSMLKNIFFHRIEDDKTRLFYKNKLDDLLKKFVSLTDFDLLDNELKKLGVKNFQLEVKKALLAKGW